MNLKNLMRVLFVVFTVGLVSLAPAVKFFGSAALVSVSGSGEDCPTGPCPTSVCTTGCVNPPTPCAGCTTITPCNMLQKGWTKQILTDSETCPSTGSLAFQTGPQCPPANTGSVQFNMGPDGASDVRFRNSNYNGTMLSDLTALSYNTFIQVANSPFVAPYVALTLDLNGNGMFDGFGVDDVIFFEPVYQDGTYSASSCGPGTAPVQGPVAACTWQSWNALVGFWWSGADFITAGGNIPCFTTIPDYLARTGHANAKILNPDPCSGGVRISAGEGRGPWDCFIGNVDKFTIAVGGATPSSVTYDFEPANCPVPDCATSPETGITACKFYDKNGNGIQDPEDIPLSGWPMTIDPIGTATPHVARQCTGVDGCVSWGNLIAGLTFTITEGTPNESSWVHSTPSSVQVSTILDQSVPATFGNYCRARSGGLTIGFWGNKNGAALITAADLTFLSGLHLRNADGSDFDPTTVKQLDMWLQKASATNMSYMLSAQLAAMELNVRHGFVNGANYAVCAGVTINQLMLNAEALLAADPDGKALAGDPNRAAQAAAQECLDSLNNNGFVALATPCTATFTPACPSPSMVSSGPLKTNVSTPLTTPRYPKLIVP